MNVREARAQKLLGEPRFAHVRHRKLAVTRICSGSEPAFQALVLHFGTWCDVCRAPAANLPLSEDLALCPRCVKAWHRQSKGLPRKAGLVAFIAWSVENRRHHKPSVPVGQRPQRRWGYRFYRKRRSRAGRCAEHRLRRQRHQIEGRLRRRRLFLRTVIHRHRLPEQQLEIMLIALIREERRYSPKLGCLRWTDDFDQLVGRGLIRRDGYLPNCRPFLSELRGDISDINRELRAA